ncbi:MAG: 2-C-methyl-D-erythritol 4-phosphate cytidylyltransferase [Bacteroidales bacterium]|nr:2-C-methyl-D-erythritol 4-phosphate cytidylyltransferase [Bacteroidales bacterium]
MERKKYLVVTAGGSGTRMGASLPKQFLELQGKPILRLTIERFLEACEDVQVITVLPSSHMGTWRDYCSGAGFHCPQHLVAGGFTRFHSVQNALEHVPDGAIVAVHDGVRPFLSAQRIRELFNLAQEHPAVVPVMPVTDTLKVLGKKADGTLSLAPEVVDRSRIYGAQTPQIFHSELLKKAYTQGFDTLFTDDASVAQKYGIPLTFVEGERLNLKITTPEDLTLAEAISNLSRSRK